MSAKVSVIVPCYNVAQYLERGIGCLSHQTLTDIEIICINDASTDDTLPILETLALMDMRINIIDFKKNAGVSAARNAGIKKATGEYIGFMDPDDMLDPDFYQKLYDSAKKNDSDMAIANLKYHTFNFINGKYRERVETNPTWRPIKTVAENLFNFNCHYTAIYNRRFIIENKLEYPLRLNNGEDTVFELKCILALHGKHGRYSVVENTFYHYMRRADSLNSPFHDMQKIRNLIDSVNMELELINNATGVSEQDYNTFMFPKIIYLSGEFLKCVTDQKSVDYIAENLIQIFEAAKYKEEFKRNRILFALLCARNKNELGKYLASTLKYVVHRYKLFGIIKIMTVIERHDEKIYKLFGYFNLWRIQF
ncbi:MAG: glycosyltransferase [Rickettsiales bacterium]|jgi:glycosyltransferase involved in cell wall biosynthesis|nr:glycosyltransferase [Rickettsiales bacterium]